MITEKIARRRVRQILEKERKDWEAHEGNMRRNVGICTSQCQSLIRWQISQDLLQTVLEAFGARKRK